MADELKGKRVAFLFTEGAEQAEVTEPLEAVRKAGAEVDVVALEKGDVQMWQHFDKGDTIKADRAVATPTRRITTGWCFREGSRTRTSFGPTRRLSSITAS
jgi:enhancing lycopene biosynthesis protein 2